MNEIKQIIIGTWKLVYSVEIDSAEKKHYPFGEDAIGYIIYNEFDRMSVQICRRERTKYHSSSFVAATAEELIHLPKDYIAYFGRYEINADEKIVRHHVEGHLFPNNVDTILDRKYHFYDDKMSLKPWDGTNREILWEKVK